MYTLDGRTAGLRAHPAWVVTQPRFSHVWVSLLLLLLLLLLQLGIVFIGDVIYTRLPTSTSLAQKSQIEPRISVCRYCHAAMYICGT